MKLRGQRNVRGGSSGVLRSLGLASAAWGFADAEGSCSRRSVGGEDDCKLRRQGSASATAAKIHFIASRRACGATFVRAIKWPFRPPHRRLHLDPSAGEGRKPPTNKLDAIVHYPHCRAENKWRKEPPSDGSREQEARLAPLVPRSGASLGGNGAVVVFTDGSSMRSAEVVTDGNPIRDRGWRP